ncbi:hypothetical protein H0H87_008423 [Tephrocybe sp. NHM501043]|nr:hypothetical protein H0H87_008423 [Tephrocybe sp. NHM501043]
MLVPDDDSDVNKEAPKDIEIEVLGQKMASLPVIVDDDEDFTLAIHLHLQEIAKEDYFNAQDIVDFVATPKMQEKLLREARIIFKAGKNYDGYFTADDLIEQVNKAIDIFEEKIQGFATGLFLYDNVPSCYQKHADNALSA